MKSVKWLRPYMTAVGKHHGVTDPERLAMNRRLIAQNDARDRMNLLAEDLADESGDYIALSARMVRWLMSINVEDAAQNANWHFPYSAVRIGVEDGSLAPPMVACWMPAADEQEDDWNLHASVRGYHPDGSPAVISTLADRKGIARMMADGLGSGFQSDGTEIVGRYTAPVEDAFRLVIALGIYLSLGIADPEIPPSSSKRIGPPKRDRPKGYKLRTLTDPPGGSGRTPHLVRPHVRQLKHERYYQGAWSAYPRGSRYSLVSAHVRGHQSENEHDAELRGLVR